MLSASVTVRPVDHAVALLLFVYASALAVIATTGAWLVETTDPSAVTVALPPVDVRASAYEARTVSPPATFSGAELLVPAVDTALVASVPLKTPVLTPVSVRVMVSNSFVRVFVTVTPTVWALAGLVLRSGSVTVIAATAPGAMDGVMPTIPVVPSAAAMATSSAVVASASKARTFALLLVTVR